MQINKKSVLYSMFRTWYEIRVSSRIGVKYNMKMCSSGTVNRFFTIVDKLKISSIMDVKILVDSQFKVFDTALCRKMFNSKFPPVNAILREKCHIEYYKIKTILQSHKNLSMDSSKYMLDEINKLPDFSSGTIILFVNSGIVSLKAVESLLNSNKISSADAIEVKEVLF